MARDLTIKNSEKWFSVQRLIGFCLLFNRSLVDKIGYLDEEFQIGGMEDDDY
ncbi:MAG: glycosyltransferase family 2 protein, partial [Firmicutes bacterium]|nr:glycosyltransferase family 2 protein [Bacillota bacterium]